MGCRLKVRLDLFVFGDEWMKFDVQKCGIASRWVQLRFVCQLLLFDE